MHSYSINPLEDVILFSQNQNTVPVACNYINVASIITQHLHTCSMIRKFNNAIYIYWWRFCNPTCGKRMTPWTKCLQCIACVQRKRRKSATTKHHPDYRYKFSMSIIKYKICNDKIHFLLQIIHYLVKLVCTWQHKDPELSSTRWDNSCWTKRTYCSIHWIK